MNQNSLKKKWLIPDLAQGIHQLSLEHLLIPEARKPTNRVGITSKIFRHQPA
jgi:hypothetical protein